MTQDKKTLDFIFRARQVHGDKYDYSKVIYKNCSAKVCIICPIHGEFWQTPSKHIYRKQGCPKCGGGVKLTLEEFIEKAKEVHGDKYDYSKVEYINAHTKICIICPIHGEFWQTPNNHLSGYGCDKCAHIKSNESRRITFEDFIKKANEIHHDKYIYSDTNFNGTKTKILITCKECGCVFSMSPSSHLRGQGCPHCGRIQAAKKRMNDSEEILHKIQEIHKDKLIYDKFVYHGLYHKSIFICPKHGDFEATPFNLLRGKGCEKCIEEELTKIRQIYTEEFKKNATIIHHGKYDYSETQCISTKIPVCIICPEHGEFWQTPSDHLKGSGCPKCNQSKLELNISRFLIENNFNFEVQKKFDWLKYKQQLRLDFYLQEYNVAVECQGRQHFMPVDFKGLGEEYATEEFKINQERDNLKRKLCEEHGIKLLYYSNLGIEYPYYVYENLDELLTEIKKPSL